MLIKKLQGETDGSIVTIYHLLMDFFTHLGTYMKELQADTLIMWAREAKCIQHRNISPAARDMDT